MWLSILVGLVCLLLGMAFGRVRRGGGTGEVGGDLPPPNPARGLFQPIVELSQNWIFHLDGAGHITYANPAALAGLSFSNERVLGQPLASFLIPAQRAEWGRRIAEQIHDRTWRTAKAIAIEPAQGGSIWLDAYCHYFADERTPGVIIIARDFTHQRELQLAARQRQSRIDEELDMARAMHLALLPRDLPTVQGLELGLTFIPAATVGGDYVEFGDARPDRFAVFFADISGHGVAAAMLSTMLKVVLAEAMESTENPGEAFQRLNERLNRAFPTGKFASASYLEINPHDRDMRFVLAAQEPLVLHRPGEDLRLFEGEDPALGLLSPEVFAADYSVQSFQLRPGDTLLLYTDGITELGEGTGAAMSRERLLEWFSESIHHSAQELADRLYERALHHTGFQEPTDDLALLVIRVG